MTDYNHDNDSFLATFIEVAEVKKRDIPLLMRLCQIYYESGRNAAMDKVLEMKENHNV